MTDQASNEPPLPSASETAFAQPRLTRLSARLRGLPWWIIILVLLFVYAAYAISRSERERDILDAMLDRPQQSTDNKFDVVYQAKTNVIVLQETVSIKLADGERISIDAADVVERKQGTLACDKEADPECLDEFGELAVFRAPAPADAEPDGYIEKTGLLRPIGNAVELPDGELVVVTEDRILSRKTGTLECDRRTNIACQDQSGEIVTFQVPYVLQTGLVTRDDVLIRHADGYIETVRPNRLSSVAVEDCLRASEPLCQGGKITTAVFDERIIGTEVKREGDNITVRTVDEELVFIPRSRIISMRTGLVECDKEANPRCQDFEGTLIERRGATVEGELTLENNRALNIIPEGETTAIEIRKNVVVSDIRTPENCRVEDEGACMIVVQEADDLVGGRIVREDDEGITLQTVAPVFVEIDRDQSTSLRRAPLDCALNNLQGCNAGIWLTLLVTIVAYSLALIGGLFVGLMRVSSNPVFYHLSTLYVELVRGTPLLVLLLFFAFVIGPLIRDSNLPVIHWFYRFINDLEVRVLGEESFLSEAVVGLAVGYAAFLAEIFRAGIESIGRGQMEAARSLGMSYFQAMRRVILPQAIRVVLPPLGNDFIAMLKDSALISVLALPDLLQVGRLYITRTFQPIPVYVIVAMLYILLTLCLSAVVRTLEKRFKLP